MNLTKILTYALFIVSLGLAYYLYDNINSTIEFQASIADTEKEIIDKLQIIREAEKVYLEQNGKYTSSWDTLINFIENGIVPITQRTETIIPLSYGKDSIYVEIDTIGNISVKDKIFKKTYTVTAADNGIFMGFDTKLGAYVVKTALAYRIKKTGRDQTEQLKFIDRGTVNYLAEVKPGDPLKKGQLLISLWDYALNPKVNIKTLGDIPGSDGKKFEIFTGKIDRNGLMVSVIEVLDPAPINPERRASNEAKNRKPLGFGAQNDVSTIGNWE